LRNFKLLQKLEMLNTAFQTGDEMGKDQPVTQNNVLTADVLSQSPSQKPIVEKPSVSEFGVVKKKRGRPRKVEK
jgi:hypothetical protein